MAASLALDYIRQGDDPYQALEKYAKSAPAVTGVETLMALQGSFAELLCNGSCPTCSLPLASIVVPPCSIHTGRPYRSNRQMAADDRNSDLYCQSPTQVKTILGSSFHAVPPLIYVHMVQRDPEQEGAVPAPPTLVFECPAKALPPCAKCVNIVSIGCGLGPVDTASTAESLLQVATSFKDPLKLPDNAILGDAVIEALWHTDDVCLCTAKTTQAGVPFYQPVQALRLIAGTEGSALPLPPRLDPASIARSQQSLADKAGKVGKKRKENPAEASEDEAGPSAAPTPAPRAAYKPPPPTNAGKREGRAGAGRGRGRGRGRGAGRRENGGRN